MNIAFCINRLALKGLGVSLCSLIRNSSNPGKLKFWFLCSNLIIKDKEAIAQLLETEGLPESYTFIDFDPEEEFGKFPSLHGDWTTYGRLLLADYICEDQVLYLDADLVVELDVLEVEAFEFDGNLLAAVGGGKFKYTLGNRFYINKVGMLPDLEYFNSGVLLINLRKWQLENVKNKCLKIANEYGQDIPSNDQSLLNIICAGRFSKLPQAFNSEWIAYQPKPDISNKMILHFAGSPKPWDPLAFFLHNGYCTWKTYLSPEWKTNFSRYSGEDYKRTWKIRHSYFRTINNRLRSLNINIGNR